MDCSTCRSFFSQSFDDRLAGERRQEFVIHLQACASCDSEFALYRRVFGAVRGLPDEAAKPFQTPSEVPGALSVLQGPSGSRPRFARVAAAALIMLGLAGTHVLVFQWSRDHASTGHPRPAQDPVIAATTPSLVSALPSALRDHVEATDLFIRTQEQLPDDADAPAVAAADWAVSNLPRLTQSLTEDLQRSLPHDLPPRDRALVHRYLKAAKDEFVPAVQAVLDRDSPRSMREIRNVVTGCQRTLRDLRDMKALTNNLARGTGYCRQPALAAVQKLPQEGRRIIEAKEARLAGELSAAIDCVSSFQTDFPKSRFQPAAAFLQFEALNAAGRPGEALTFIITNQGIEVSGSWVRVLKMIQLPEGGLSWIEPDDRIHGYILKLSAFPMKSEGCGVPHLADYGFTLPLGPAPESRPSRAPRPRKPEDPK